MTSPKIEVVRFIDWNEGFRKIEFTKLLRESESHSRLRDAKVATDELLEGKAIEVVVQVVIWLHRFVSGCESWAPLGIILEQA